MAASPLLVTLSDAIVEEIRAALGVAGISCNVARIRSEKHMKQLNSSLPSVGLFFIQRLPRAPKPHGSAVQDSDWTWRILIAGYDPLDCTKPGHDVYSIADVIRARLRGFEVRGGEFLRDTAEKTFNVLETAIVIQQDWVHWTIGS